MPAPLQVLRIGDELSHGGVITTGSLLSKSNGIPIAREGDLAVCESHGTVTIIATSIMDFDEGLAVAREGDTTSCGATLIPSSVDIRKSE